MRQRRATAAAPSSKDNITQNLMMYYMDDTPGIKVGPMTVLVMTLVYMSIVVMLHILGKFKETITG
ncbi:Sec61beta family protein [Cryptosporidium serpentis]